MGGKAAAVTILVLLAGSLVQTQSDAPPPSLPFTAPESCGEDEFYQSGNLSCVQCLPFSASSEDGMEPGSIIRSQAHGKLHWSDFVGISLR